MKILYIAPLLLLLTGSIVYCVLAMVAAFRYRQSGAPRLSLYPPVSILRPMSGSFDNTEANLRSLFEQQYPAPFEVLLSVHDEADPAAKIAVRVMNEHPYVPARLVVAGESPLPNAKVWSLRRLWSEARYEHIVMSDSDIFLKPDAMITMLCELEQPNIGLVTCPYRAHGGPGVWGVLQSIGLNTDFLAGMLTQRMLNGMDFAIGCTVATRKSDIASIGGLEHLQKYLAEDFMMGNLMHKLGRGVVLSRSVIEHYIGNLSFWRNWTHRLRWARSTRRSRPWGYAGELFTKTTAIALLLLIAAPGAWGFCLLALMFRAGQAFATAVETLDDPLTARYWWLLPVEDISGFLTWLLGFFGRTITWRGRRLILARDGSFEMPG